LSKNKKSDEESQHKGSSSFFNESEIKRIKTTLDFLNKSYKKIEKKPSVGVITFYGSQLLELTNLEKKDFGDFQGKIEIIPI
jgi:hypothetical protein